MHRFWYHQTFIGKYRYWYSIEFFVFVQRRRYDVLGKDKLTYKQSKFLRIQFSFYDKDMFSSAQ